MDGQTAGQTDVQRTDRRTAIRLYWVRCRSRKNAKN